MFPPRASSHRESITVPDIRAIQSLRQRFKSFSTMFYIFVCLLEKKKKKALSDLLVIKATLPLPAKKTETAFLGRSVLPHRRRPGTPSKGERLGSPGPEFYQDRPLGLTICICSAWFLFIL